MIGKIQNLALASALIAFATPVMAANVDGATLSLMWGIPFAGILLSIALFPIFASHFWHHNFGKVALFWALVFLVPFTLTYGAGEAVGVVAHAAIEEYIPFIILLLALYTVSGGILVGGHLHGSPKLNTGLIAAGTVLASVMGTTGAAMLFIRPILRANENRKYRVHIVIFFIFLVANVGGGLTPLGDPPLFLGFLKGVDFAWTFQNMLPEVLFMAVSLLVIFFVLDTVLYKKEDPAAINDTSHDTPLKLEGLGNLGGLLVIVSAVLMSGLWKPEISFNILGSHLALQNVARDVILLLVTFASLRLTPQTIRQGNDFNWDPILEVAKLFAAIFLTIFPVIAILRAGTDGALADVVRMVTAADGQPIDSMYFWMTGMLSGFLDNAPTYLVFFNMASGDAQVLMHQLTSTLIAISAGSVFFGALTYIGNAPNFMVKAIAEQRGVPMPTFFGYILWSAGILLPLFLVATFIFF